MSGVYLGDHKALAETHFGHAIFVDTRDVSIAPHLLHTGRWEAWITDALGPFLKGSLFVDVGANFGWFTLFAHHAEAKKLIAIEPNPRLCELLAQTLAVNGIRCELRQEASGAQKGEQHLTFDWKRVCDGTLYSDDREKAGWNDMLLVENEQVVVPVQPLDTVLKDPSDLPIVLKIDAEGYEPQVVFGAQSTLRSKDCTAFVEYHPDPTGERQLAAMLDFFAAENYRMAHVRTDSELRPVKREDLANLSGGDMLCFRRFPS